MRLTLPFMVCALGCATAPKPAPESPQAAPPPPLTAAAPAEKSSAPTAEPPKEAPPPRAAVHFEFDRADLTTADQNQLNQLADSLRSRPALKVKVAGHCDELGTEEYNLALGQRRADAARAYLVRLGVEPARVEAVSFGEEQPADAEHTPEAWAANRRAELDCSAH